MKKSLLTALILTMSFLQLNAAVKSPTVGIEGKVEVELGGVELIAREVDRRSDLIVYIASAEKAGDNYSYDIRFIGQVPGTFNISQYLLRKDGSSVKDLPPIEIKIAPLLPETHQGGLIPERIDSFNLFESYGKVIFSAWLFWGLLLLPLIFAGRRRSGPPPLSFAHLPTLAERLEPLVLAASRGELDATGLALIEKILLQYWREELQLTSVSAYEAMKTMKNHQKAGALIRKLEQWLHRPGTETSEQEIEELLTPYRKMPAEGSPKGPGKANPDQDKKSKEEAC